ncbi:hypothetical protein AVEN_129082-1 [Araneus ventricosus]|uniref:Uncharacterized protein n=1 Tax=Araneus ventricosus TaxID=182803 RepID=A0A4Y2MRP1_ARAVE|nr:hypothetical protein AVEN_129082-1 [Araneus ventricosus]
MLGPWIHEVISIPGHVHPPDTIANKTRQTRQLVSSHQQFNGGVGGPRRGSQRWVVDQYNACCPFELDYDLVGLGLENICSIDDKEFKRCSDEFLSHFKKRYAEAAIGLHGPDESPAFEKGRACLEAIVSFCESNPDGCMSTG